MKLQYSFDNSNMWLDCLYDKKPELAVISNRVKYRILKDDGTVWQSRIFYDYEQSLEVLRMARWLLTFAI